MASTTQPVGTTTSGVIAGRVHHGVIQFAGVPYAAAPVGARRFRPPEPLEPWAGVREATAFGPVSWQAHGSMASLLGSAELHLDEDCLTLNVRTPALDDGGRPVMVWIHGGGFVSGSGSTPWYDGIGVRGRQRRRGRHLNYRLGALGFLHLGGPHGRRARTPRPACRHPRPGRRARVGARQHRGVRRRSRQRHHLRRVGRRHERRHPARPAARRGPVPPGHRPERRAPATCMPRPPPTRSPRRSLGPSSGTDSTPRCCSTPTRRSSSTRRWRPSRWPPPAGR